MTDHQTIVSAICELDPKGESVELSKALYILSLSKEKEYSDHTELFNDALAEYNKQYC